MFLSALVRLPGALRIAPGKVAPFQGFFFSIILFILRDINTLIEKEKCERTKKGRWSGSIGA